MKKLIVLLVLLYSLPCFALTASVTEYGTFSYPKKGSDSIEMAMDIKELKLINNGNRIKAKLGTAFGFKFKVSEPCTIRYTHKYPGIRSKGKLKYNTEREFYTEGDSWVGFIFEEQGELVKGTWIFTVYTDGKFLCQKEFTVY